MNVLLIGEESAGIQMLEALERSEHCVVAVMASPSKSGASLWNAASKFHLETWPATLVKSPVLAARLRAASVDIILNVHSLHIIHREVLRAAKIGAFNLHPGPLPRYAGLNAVSWALYNGERQHGVTVHKMVPEIDAGPIVYQTLLSIDEQDTALSLSAKCAREGIALMLRLLETASRDPNAVPLADQHLSRREYFGADIPRDGWISWSGSATDIVNFVRACDYFPFRSPWGHPRTTLGNQEIAIVKAFCTRTPCTAPAGHVEDLVQGGALVASADECILVKRLKIGQHVHKAGEMLKIGDRLGN
jgi:methionyl-tRNA formyltransferase